MEENVGVRLGADGRDVCDYWEPKAPDNVNRANLFSGPLFGFSAPDDFRRGDEMARRYRRMRGEKRQ